MLSDDKKDKHTKKQNRKEQDKMNAVLSMEEYRHTSTPQNKKSNNKSSCSETILMGKDLDQHIYELEIRQSSADEFPLLWGDEEE